MCVMMVISNMVITHHKGFLYIPWLFITKFSITNLASQRAWLLTVDVRMVVAHSAWESPTVHGAVQSVLHSGTLTGLLNINLEKYR